MELAVGICHEGGVLLPAGATVSERHLKQLRDWGITEVEPERPVSGLSEIIRGAAEVVDLQALGMEKAPPKWRPPGQDAADGKTFIVTEPITYIEDIVRFDRPTVIQGSIGAHVRIEAVDLQVEGDIGKGVKITSRGDVAARGEILGSSERPVVLEAERLSLHGARHARLTARHSLHAVDLIHCHARAGQDIHVVGADHGVVAGELEAGASIHCGTVGGDGDEPAVLKVTMIRQKQLFQAITQLERAQVEKTEEMNHLAKVMEVIRLLGEKVVALPPEKKQELALQSRRYMELKTELADLKDKLDRALAETEKEVTTIDQCPIRIGRLQPGIELVIGAATLKLMARQNTTGYYLKSGRIRALSNI